LRQSSAILRHFCASPPELQKGGEVAQPCNI
jgi:hypothetical protein